MSERIAHSSSQLLVPPALAYLADVGFDQRPGLFRRHHSLVCRFDRAHDVPEAASHDAPTLANLHAMAQAEVAVQFHHELDERLRAIVSSLQNGLHRLWVGAHLAGDPVYDETPGDRG